MCYNHNEHNIFWQRKWTDGVYGCIIRKDSFAVQDKKAKQQLNTKTAYLFLKAEDLV